MEDYSNELANVLSTAGFSNGDVVALMMNNCPEQVCTWLGLAKIGVISALINTNLKLGVLAHCINTCKAKAVILSENFKSGKYIENIVSNIILYIITFLFLIVHNLFWNVI